jgi:hypothetical protein
MKKVLIFCEGITDQVFISDCLEFFFGLNVTKTQNPKDRHKLKIFFGERCEIVDIEGCSKLSNKIHIDTLKDNTEEGGINIVIFDADCLGSGNNGFDSANQKLLDIRKQNNVVFDFYLWHNNDSDGEVEDLLRQMIPTENERIFNCIITHQECLVTIENSNIRIANLKEQLGYYLYTLSQDSHPSKRNYKDAMFWNLNHDQVPDLLKFKVFLESVMGIKPANT